MWHFYLGDPVQMVLLHPDGTVTPPVLGQDLLEGESPQVVVAAGTWMGADLVAGGEYGAVRQHDGSRLREQLLRGRRPRGPRRRLPAAAAEIERLTRPEAPTVMPEGL